MQTNPRHEQQRIERNQRLMQTKIERNQRIILYIIAFTVIVMATVSTYIILHLL